MTTTLSIRVPSETRRWLERFAKRRGSAGMAAVRVLEEAQRREEFPMVEFRDTHLGRVAYVQGTRVQVGFVYGQLLHDATLTEEALAKSFAWPRWKAAGVLAYMRAFPDECKEEWEELQEADEIQLKRSLPNMEVREVASP